MLVLLGGTKEGIWNFLLNVLGELAFNLISVIYLNRNDIKGIQRIPSTCFHCEFSQIHSVTIVYRAPQLNALPFSVNTVKENLL